MFASESSPISSPLRYARQRNDRRSPCRKGSSSSAVTTDGPSAFAKSFAFAQPKPIRTSRAPWSRAEKSLKIVNPRCAPDPCAGSMSRPPTPITTPTSSSKSNSRQPGGYLDRVARPETSRSNSRSRRSARRTSQASPERRAKPSSRLLRRAARSRRKSRRVSGVSGASKRVSAATIGSARSRAAARSAARSRTERPSASRTDRAGSRGQTGRPLILPDRDVPVGSKVTSLIAEPHRWFAARHPRSPSLSLPTRIRRRSESPRH